LCLGISVKGRFFSNGESFSGFFSFRRRKTNLSYAAIISLVVFSSVLFSCSSLSSFVVFVVSSLSGFSAMHFCLFRAVATSATTQSRRAQRGKMIGRSHGATSVTTRDRRWLFSGAKQFFRIAISSPSFPGSSGEAQTADCPQEHGRRFGNSGGRITVSG